MIKDDIIARLRDALACGDHFRIEFLMIAERADDLLRFDIVSGIALAVVVAQRRATRIIQRLIIAQI